MFYKIYTDGGSRGNPGPGAAGVVVYDEKNRLIDKFGKTVGIVTNNIAEYLAVYEALLWVKNSKQTNRLRQDFGGQAENSKQKRIEFYLDSLLVASQLGGVYKIKDPKLKDLYFKIQILIGELKVNVSFSHIPREENKLADEQVNKALDKEPVTG
ncbi:MAG: ribonuclease HI family protein [Patescibacteria group bacterium]|nr:ribonuclease HI family protein [Patescibacteria group bacterium]